MQDLERQLAESKEVIKQLSVSKQSDAPQQGMELDFPETPQSNVTDNRPNFVKLPRQASSNIRRFCLGIFEAPFETQTTRPSHSYPLSSQQLPPKASTDRLLSSYYHSIHRDYTVFEWDHFADRYESVYKRGSFATEQPGWVALFYAILAISTISASESAPGKPVLGLEGRQLIEQATKILVDGRDDPTLDCCQAALLASIYYVEVNDRSAGRKQLTSAVECAYDLGLHEESDLWPTLEAEYRRRLWWWVYLWDR